MSESLKQTKIIATLGPASSNELVLKEMIDAGVDVIRINASHCAEPSDIQTIIDLVRSVSEEYGKPLGLFLDLQGPKIRVGTFKDKEIFLELGDLFLLTSDQSIEGDQKKVSISYPELIDDLELGQQLYIDDGNIRLEVVEKRSKDVVCRVLRGGRVSNNKGINLPMTQTRIPTLTEKDLRDLEVAVSNQLEYVAHSFISSSEDVLLLKQHIDRLGGNDIGVIAKIERKSAVDNIVSIIKVADVIMVARGDLGVEIGIENVPEAQKLIIRESIRYIKPVIVATQMLESMVEKKLATRAEVSDVANAIYDRCDAVMLSGETAMGIDPANAVAMMKTICVATDHNLSERKKNKFSQVKRVFEVKTMATSFCKAADAIADENDADVMLAFTSSGNTPLISSKLTPSIPIIAPTDSIHVLKKMQMYRGVIPIMMPQSFSEIKSWARMIDVAIRSAKSDGLLKAGDKVVVTAGFPIGIPGGTNSIRMVTVQ